jgi:hypothetical protein
LVDILPESGGVHIVDRDVIELSNDESRAFMVKVTTGIGDMGVNVRRLTSFTPATSAEVNAFTEIRQDTKTASNVHF